MRNSLLSLSVFFLIVFLGYSIFWYNQAHKIRRNVTDLVETISLPYAEAGQMSFAYERIEVKGFPFGFTTRFLHPFFSMKTQAMESELQAKAFDVTRPLWSRDYSLSVQGDLLFVKRIDKKEYVTVTSYSSAPKLHVKMDREYQGPIWNKGQSILSHITSMRYRDSGSEVRVKQTEEILSTSRGLRWEAKKTVKKDQDPKWEIEVRIKDKRQHYASYIHTIVSRVLDAQGVSQPAQDHLRNVLEALGTVVYDVDMEMTVHQQTDNVLANSLKLEVDDISIRTEPFGMSFSGDVIWQNAAVEKVKGDWKLWRYKGFVDFLIDTDIIMPSFSADAGEDPNEKQAFVAASQVFLQELSGNANGKENLVFGVEYDKGKEVRVGGYVPREMLGLYEQVFVE